MTTPPLMTPDRPPEQRVYLVYDARAEYDVDEASVLFSSESFAAAQAAAHGFSPDCVIYVYRLVNGVATDGQRVVMPK